MALVVGMAVGGTGVYFMTGDAGTEAAGKDGAPAANAKPKAPMGQAVHIALADHSPRLGPEHAKVTILEFSDFQ